MSFWYLVSVGLILLLISWIVKERLDLMQRCHAFNEREANTENGLEKHLVGEIARTDTKTFADEDFTIPPDDFGSDGAAYRQWDVQVSGRVEHFTMRIDGDHNVSSELPTVVGEKVKVIYVRRRPFGRLMWCPQTIRPIKA